MSRLILTDKKFKGAVGSGNWVLCIGAGASKDLVPTWEELTRRLINQVLNSHYSSAEFKSLISKSGWGLDAWIQAAANIFIQNGNELSAFNNILEECLYGDLISLADKHGIKDQLIIALNDPRNITKENVLCICTFFESNFPNSTLISLAKVLIFNHKRKHKLPKAILTFNADTLLHSIIELLQRRDHYLGPLPHSHPEYFYKTILRSAGGLPNHKIPIIHCHGAIKPRTQISGPHRYDSRDRLIFLEEEYLKIVTSTSSWPETIFMFYAQSTKMVFVGLSMADPNIRRWMSIAHQTNMNDLRVISNTEKIVLKKAKHLWLTTMSEDDKFDTLKESSLRHLGVRPAWLHSWSDLEKGMLNILGA